MNKSIIIHGHSLNCGGIGDFIRASLSFYSFCQRNNIEYYIDFNENPYLKSCFEINQIPTNIKFEENLYLLNGYYSYEDIKKNLENILNNPKVYYLKSNAVGFEKNEDINKIKDYFFQNILKPSEKVIKSINNIFSKYNLEDNNYISIHIRCGDMNMQNKQTESIDNRINLDNEDIYNNYKNIINNFKDKYGEELSIVIHSDSINFKNKLKQLNSDIIILDLDIKHIAENIGLNNENSFISTITEFYIISKAKKIFMPYPYSGFSHIASLIESKPLYTCINNHHLLDLFDASKIIII